MGYYFGCGTGANRCAWFWYVLIVAAGIASLSFWGYQNTGCINQSMTCAENAGLANQLTANNTHFVHMASPEQFCNDLFGSRPNNTAVVNACLNCANQWVGCWEPTVPLLYAGVILMIASLFPCFYCCCCSSPPSSEKYY